MEKEHDLAKWLSGEMKDEERNAFEQSPEFKTYDRIAKYSSVLEVPGFESERIYLNVISRPKKAVKVVPLNTKWIYRVAAILVIALGLFFASQNFTATTEIAGAGKQTTFSLPDQSEVVLNSGSDIEYKKWNWSNNRMLKLNGEAFFKVAKGKTFDVNTDLGKVTVVGTQFNVKSREHRFEVMCFEGKVKVQNNDEIFFITKGEMVTFENGKKIMSHPAKSIRPLWMSHQMVFNAENIKTIEAELERQYALTIESKNINGDKKFTGTIPSNNINVALKIITKTYGLRYKRIGNSKIILSGE